MKLRLISLAALLVFFSSAAFAWNCSDPLASRVAVGTTKPSGTAGDGDGQWFLGTGGEGTKGVYYVCEVPKKPKTGGGKSSSTSTSTSTSGASATGGNSSSTATGGNATGGNSTSTSGVKNSGNSSNTNNNTANGGTSNANGNGSNNQTTATGGTVSGSGNSTQGQKQGQGQTQSSSSNNSGGNSSNAYTSNTQVDASKIPVATAFAPTTIPTVSCFKGFGAGVQTMPVGASFGGGKIDENCRALQTALHAPNRLTYCKLYVNLQDSKKAHITMEDCMAQDPQPVVEAPAPPQPQQPQVIVVPVSSNAPVAPTPVPVIAEEIPLGICTFASKTSCVAPGSDAALTDPSRPTSICKEMLAAARRELAAHPGYVIVLTGNRNRNEDVVLAASRANRAKQELMAAGVKSSQIKTEVGTGTARTVKIDLVPAN
jgi:hypothetical protein